MEARRVCSARFPAAREVLWQLRPTAGSSRTRPKAAILQRFTRSISARLFRQSESGDRDLMPRHLLIVDDDPTVRISLAEALADNGTTEVRVAEEPHRSEERRVGKEGRSRWSP